MRRKSAIFGVLRDIGRAGGACAISTLAGRMVEFLLLAPNSRQIQMQKPTAHPMSHSGLNLAHASAYGEPDETPATAKRLRPSAFANSTTWRGPVADGIAFRTGRDADPGPVDADDAHADCLAGITIVPRFEAASRASVELQHRLAVRAPYSAKPSVRPSLSGQRFREG